ncbi:unnamed protein product, partial [Mesorhabditis spiculigera]
MDWMGRIEKFLKKGILSLWKESLIFVILWWVSWALSKSVDSRFASPEDQERLVQIGDVLWMLVIALLVLLVLVYICACLLMDAQTSKSNSWVTIRKSLGAEGAHHWQGRRRCHQPAIQLPENVPLPLRR